MLDWEAKRYKAEENADWVVWGSRITEPRVCVSLEGVASVSDDMGIIAVSKRGGRPEGTPNQSEIATRIAECVTAMSGIADPVAFIEDVRSLLLGYCRGECEDPRTDPKAMSLFGRCIPLGELERIGHEQE